MQSNTNIYDIIYCFVLFSFKLLVSELPSYSMCILLNDLVTIYYTQKRKLLPHIFHSLTFSDVM